MSSKEERDFKRRKRISEIMSEARESRSKAISRRGRRFSKKDISKNEEQFEEASTMLKLKRKR